MTRSNTKRPWVKPQLNVFVSSTAEESVLGNCKYNGTGVEAGPDYVQNCVNTTGAGACRGNSKT